MNDNICVHTGNELSQLQLLIVNKENIEIYVTYIQTDILQMIICKGLKLIPTLYIYV
jgi:hypothetical protein